MPGPLPPPPAPQGEEPAGRAARGSQPLAAAALVLVLVLVGTALLAGRAARGEAPASPAPDFEFYKARVAPIVHRVCAECHADPRDRKGRHLLRPPQGRPVRERDHEANYRTILRLLQPGDPSASPWLLKPLGPDQGGLPHGGGPRVRYDSLEYGTMIDFINGAKLPPPRFTPPSRAPGEPDFRWFVAHVEPVVRSVCAQCHVGKGPGRMGLVLPAGAEPTPEEHLANFQAVLRHVDARRPLASRFLRKPLAVADGGTAHEGGDRILAGDPAHDAWLGFLGGADGPPLPWERARGPLEIGPEDLVIQAEDMEREGDLAVVGDRDAEGGRLVGPGPGGGSLTATFMVPEAAPYVVSVRLRGPGGALGLRVDLGAPIALDPPPEGYAEAGPRVLVDGQAPMLEVTGEVEATPAGLSMRGQADAPASWLSPARVRHVAVEARVRLAPDDGDEADDALLLFDMEDGENGKYLGLVDGGRRAVMGLLEGGQPRALSSARLDVLDDGGDLGGDGGGDADDEPGEDAGRAPGHVPRDAPRRLRVEFLPGVAVGRVDGRPLVFLHLDRHLGQGLFGMRTHGDVQVVEVTLHEQWEVHRFSPARAPILPLPAGLRRLRIEIPPGGAFVDRVLVKEAGP